MREAGQPPRLQPLQLWVGPEASYVRAGALLNQMRGTVLSMVAIREVNSHAALVQTEDLGRVYGTPAMQEQVDFENLRRWLSFDLLCGRVDVGTGCGAT